MGLIAVLVFGLGMAFTSAVLDYFNYEDMIAEYNEWARITKINES